MRKLHEWQAKGKPLWYICAKSRRVGISAQAGGLLMCHSLEMDMAEALIVAHQAKSSKELFKIPQMLVKGIPVPGIDTSNQNKIVFPHDHGDSTLTIATAGSVVGGRGMTLTGLHGCLTPDTLVMDRDGNHFPIVSIPIGSVVYTHAGARAEVTRRFSNRQHKTILRIKAWLNCEELKLTPDHKVWTQRGWVEAGALTLSDYLGTPLREITGQRLSIDLPHTGNTQGKQCKVGTIPFDKEFGFFVGYYLAEGNAKYQHKLFSGNKRISSLGLCGHENEGKYMERVAAFIQPYVKSFVVKHVRQAHKLIGNVYGASFAKLIVDNFGEKNSKRIPDWVFDCPRDFVLGIALGYISGDGSKDVQKSYYDCPKISVTGIRPRLIYQLRNLLGALGIGWGGVQKEKAFVDKRGWNNRESWTLDINGMAAIYLRDLLGFENVTSGQPKFRNRAMKHKLENDTAWVRVKSIEEMLCDTEVCDIEIGHDDHSFETPLGAVANSEVAYWAGAESFASLLPSVQRSSDSIIVLESTANGTVGIGETFYAYWNAAVEGRNDFCPIFLTHLDDPFCRNFDAVVRDIGEGDIADYEREMVTLMKRRKIGKQEQQERISWVRSTLETQCQGLSIMLEQEYPITAEMAFVSTGLPAFEKSEMSWAEECVQEPKAIGRFASAGDQLAGVWEDRRDGEWHVWEFPLAGCHYYLGADAAAGEELGESGQSRPVGDFSSIYIWNGETGNLAAKMAGRISPDFLADEVNKAGRYYNNAMASIELTGNLGRWALVRLRDKHRYPHFYRWKGRDDYIGKRNMMANKSGIGWDTNPATRELMFSAFRCALREGRIFPRSRALVNQMRNCSRIEGFKWELRRGFDDELCAGLIAWIAREQWAPPVGLGGRRPEEPDGEQPMLNRVRVQDDYAGQLQRHVQKVLGYKSQKVANERLNGV